MKNFKKQLSWLLVIALVVSSLVIGFGTIKVSAVDQATGQLATYHFQVKTAGQDCNGTGTANSLTVQIFYSDGTNATANTIAGEGNPNYFEAGNTDGITLSPQLPAKPISSINFNSTGGDRWKVDWVNFYYSPDSGGTWLKIGTFGGFDEGSPNKNFAYPSDYSLNTSSLNKTLTFNANGGSGGKQIYSEYGATLPASNIPTVSRTGYTFTGWSPGVPANGPSADATYTAQWSVNSYSIYFNGNGGSTPATITQNYGTAVTVPSSSRTGYTFAGWSPACPTTMPANDTSCVAQWSINQYSVTFDSAGGSAVSTITQNYGTTITAPADPTRTGYTFAGWSPGIPGTMPANNTNCVAQWTVNQYSVTFDSAGGSAVSTITQNYGTSITPPANPTKAGYTFGSWSPAVPGTMPAYTTNCVAQWNINSYTVTFDANGGSGGWSQSLVYGSPITPPTVTRAGYTFTGWSPTPPGTVPVGGGSYTAQWSINPYTIYFDEQGGSTVADITQNYGTTVTAPANPTKTGYTFTGWTPAVPGTMPAGNTTCVAGWTINQYTISFDSTGGSAVGSITQNYGTSVTAPADPTRTGYTFTGWSPGCPSTMPANDTNCVAGWTANNYNITFDANGGTGGWGPTAMAYGATLTAPTVTRAGYTFNGWSPSVPSTVPAADSTYTAQWVINQYTVSFDSNGGSAVSSITQNYGTPITAPDEPTRTGFTFTGWSPACPSTMPAGNTNCVAQWSVNSYNLTYDANGGTGGTGPTLTEFGTALSAPTVTRTGYTFTGWDPEVAATMPAADTTYTAQWSLNSYTITWAANGGTGGGSNACDHGAMPTEISAGTKTGYTFAGWSPGVTAATGPATYTAQWTANSYSVTYNGYGSTSGSTADSSHTYDVAGALTANGFAKTGHSFLGWSTTAGGAVAYSDEESVTNLTATSGGVVTFFAVWEIISYNITWDASGGTGGGINACDYGAMPTEISAGTREGYVFIEWSPAIVEATADTTYTAQWALDAPELVAPVGTTTVINNTNALIYGLAQYVSQEDFEAAFVEVLGNGRLEITQTPNGFGTGTKVELINNSNEEVVATYYIVIFGDVNGDGFAGAVDADIINNRENYLVEWNEIDEFYLFTAGDVNGDLYSGAVDADIINNCENYLMEIDQATGLASEIV